MTWLRVKLFVDIFSALWLAAQSLCFSAPLEARAEVRDFRVWYERTAFSVPGLNERVVREVIAEAMEDWNSAGANARFVPPGPGAQLSRGDVIIAARSLPRDRGGQMRWDGRYYWAELNTNFPGFSWPRQTARCIWSHEMGHVLVGPQHTGSDVRSPALGDGTTQRALMSPGTNSCCCVTQSDAARVIARFGRRPQPLPRPEPPPEFPEGISVDRGDVITPHKRFTAFDGYSGPLAVTAADVLRNGMTEVIVASTGSNRNNQVRVFHGRWIERDVGQPLLLGWHPFGAYRGGVRIAYGELSGGARRFVVAQASSPGRVRTFGLGGNPVHEWVAFPQGASALDVRENRVLVFRGNAVKQFTLTGQLLQEWD